MGQSRNLIRQISAVEPSPAGLPRPSCPWDPAQSGPVRSGRAAAR